MSIRNRKAPHQTRHVSGHAASHYSTPVSARTYRRRRLMVGTAAALVVACVAGSVISDISASRSLDDVASSSSSAPADKSAANKDAGSEAAKTLTPTETALNGIAGLDGTAQISASGFALDSNAQMQLEQELSVFSSYGYSASFVMVDMTTGKALSSYSGTARYSASAIKGPYVLSLAATGALDLDVVSQGATESDAYIQQLIDQAITVSDNDAYVTLYDTYGAAPFAQWAAQAGTDADVTEAKYLYLSAGDMARMWAQGYDFLFDANADGASVSSDASSSSSAASSSASDSARQWLAGEFGDTLNSSIHMALGDEYAVYSKAGWINGEGDYYALNDAGIVSSASGDYVLAVMTDACGEYGLLTDLIALLDSIHSASMSA